MVKSAQSRQRLRRFCVTQAPEMGPSDVRRGRESALPFPFDNCRKNETFFLNEPTFLQAELAEIAIMFSSQTTPSPTKHFSVNHSLTSTVIIPPYVCVKSCTIPHKCFYHSSADYDAMLQYRYPVVQLFYCVLLEVHFCH